MLFLIGNLGVVQAATLGVVARCGELVKAIEADALAIHLNPGQELIQVDGDRDFRGAVDTIARLVDALPAVPVDRQGDRLRAVAAGRRRGCSVGVTTVDVAGAGGTSWVAVEAGARRRARRPRRWAASCWDWGLPTAVAVVGVRCARA
jgi:isopentenyl-diphosphate delta-isomerase